ncbi:MAG: hypothetical protein J0H29_22910 [Sphingobacteriales bacterium]|nr:hypothetical protein [Sphingobacteriales bacterium]OJY89681.1 MAG: hypothetical protein BGP14_22490 [Sphingobacteriales bacterium 44-15]
MNGNLYQQRPLSDTSFFQKLFKQVPQENAVIELNNLLAAKPVLNISQRDIEAIEGKYRLNLRKEFKLNLEEFYAVYLNHCLADKVINDDELKELNHLKQVLYLDDKTIDKLHTKLGEIIYKKSFREAVADGRLTKAEEDFLAKLETTLRLPKQLADKISSETRTAFVENYVAQMVADQRLSPAEEQELQAIACSLNVNIQLNDQTKEQLGKLKLYWALENLDLPVIQPDIAIQKSEVCHVKISNVNWHELRSVRQRVSYSGYSTSFKLAKGFYLRSGSYQPQSYSVDTMKLIDTGTLYLTNKRIIFTGMKKNANIRIDKILDFTPHTDGVAIGRETGKSPTLQMAQNADIFCIILERLLNER